MHNSHKISVYFSFLSHFINKPKSKKVYEQTLKISLEELYDDIKNNLQIILNDRGIALELPIHLSELTKSSINFGIQDFTHYFWADEWSKKKLCQNIKQQIERFEPRLRQVKVNFQQDSHDGDLTIRIEAVIGPDPAMQAAFESRLDLTKKTFYLL